MKKNFYLFGSLVCLLLTACSPDEPLIQGEDSAEARSEKTELQSSGFQVSRAMVDKFLRITQKEKSVETVVPMVRQGDTLAYYVQYAKGWDIISGDTRFAPVMIQSEDAPLDLIKDNPNKDVVNGLLAYIQDTRKSNEGKEYGLWKLFKPQEKNGNGVISRSQNGLGQGMWIPIDTVYEEHTFEVPHIIKTKWGQDWPWYEFTPYKLNSSNNLVHTPVGCVAVATGQIIYHFRVSNPRNCMIPTSASLPYVANTKANFSNFSSSAWSNLAKRYNEDLTKCSNTAIFLAYLGDLLNTNYRLTGSSANPQDVPQILNNYLIESNSINNYNYTIVISNLLSNKPIYISANEGGHTDGHSFIVDAYFKSSSILKSNLYWDSDHIITEYEFEHCPPDLFEEPAIGYGEKEIIIWEDFTEFIGMNWGYDGSYDNTYYTVRYKRHGYDPGDGSGWIDGADYYYSPYWTAANVKKMFYNLREAQ